MQSLCDSVTLFQYILNNNNNDDDDNDDNSDNDNNNNINDNNNNSNKAVAIQGTFATHPLRTRFSRFSSFYFCKFSKW